MNLFEIARIYTQLVEADNAIPETDVEVKDKITALRSEVHQLLMDKMTEEGVEFADRFDAANTAFDMVKKAKAS